MDTLLRQLREALALDDERSWEIAHSGSAGLGEDPETARDRLAGQADVRLALVSPAYLAEATGERPALPAVDRLVTWARSEGKGEPRLCALLGDVGMGKTTTAKLFTQRLFDLRAAGAAGPLPILFDLRDVRIADVLAKMTLDHILNSMLDAARLTSIPRDRLTAGVVRRRLDQGDAVVVLDGLDEVLVHLSPHDRQLFTRQLWRPISEATGAKMPRTCRTQYFRTIRDEVTYFTGEGRHGLRGEDYLALLMLPFRPEQVREYLAANLGRQPGPPTWTATRAGWTDSSTPSPPCTTCPASRAAR